MRQIHPATTVMAAVDDLGAPVFHRADPSGIAIFGAGDPAAKVGPFEQAGLQGDAQVAVEDDGLGVRPFGETDGEQGIVDQQGVDADDNG